MADLTTFRWRKTNAPTASSRTDDIWFLNEKVGWAVNSNGQILKTEDGFSTFVQQKLLPASYLRCIGFADEKVGFVGTLSGEHRLYRTIDGGANWDPITNLPAGAPAKICGLSVVDAQTIYASGTNHPDEPSGVIKSQDGGTTWTSLDLGTKTTILVDIHFADRNEGWVVGGEDVVQHPGRLPVREDVIPIVLHTTDGGLTWSNVISGPPVLHREFPRGEWGWKIQLLENSVLLVALENFRDGAILRSDDRGATWRRLRLNDQQRNSNLEGVGFVDRNRGWVGGWGSISGGGFTSSSVDGGANWSNANEVGFRLNRFRFIGNPVQVGYASGDTVYKFSSEADAPVAVAPSLAPAAARDQRALERGDDVSFDVNIPAGSPAVSILVWERFGKQVARLMDEKSASSGLRKIRWDFTDTGGNKVPAGPYIVRVVIGTDAESFIVNRLDSS
jgi:photosystem II stability/assembly factor-like uncharacterized protein